MRTGKEIKSAAEDKLTKEIGQFGTWQIFVFILLSVPVKLTALNMSLGIIILAPKTNFLCSDTNVTENVTIDSCYSDCAGYEYSSQFGDTIISEWQLVCDRAWLANLAQSFNMFGILIGSIVFGYVSDRYGRRLAIISSCCLQMALSFATAFCNDYWTFAVTRFFLGAGTAGNMMTAFVLIQEIIGPSYRELVTCTYHLPLAVAESLMPIIGFYSGSWRVFSLAVAAPTLMYLTYFFLIPESPKWLISKGRLDEARSVMNTATKWNNRPSTTLDDTLKELNSDINGDLEKKVDVTYISFIKIPSLRAKNLFSCVSWFCLGVNYYGASQFVGQTSENIYISMALAGLLKVPSNLLSGYLYRRFGRRATILGLQAASAGCFALLAVPALGFYVRTTAGALGLAITTGAFTTMYTFTSELFPTVTRNMAMGVSSTVSRVGSAVAPFVVGLSGRAPWLPAAAFGLAALASIAACYNLPETRGRKLPDTLDEENNTIEL